MKRSFKDLKQSFQLLVPRLLLCLDGGGPGSGAGDGALPCTGRTAECVGQDSTEVEDNGALGDVEHLGGYVILRVLDLHRAEN